MRSEIVEDVICIPLTRTGLLIDERHDAREGRRRCGRAAQADEVEIAKAARLAPAGKRSERREVRLTNDVEASFVP